MANVQLNWTAEPNPDSNGIESQVVYRFPGSITYAGLLSAMGLSSSDISDGEGSNPTTDRQITGLTAAQAAAFAADPNVDHLTDGNELAKDATSYTNMTVASGTYVYGVFSKNSVGIGPGELQQQTV